jgi:hypothetical protein
MARSVRFPQYLKRHGLFVIFNSSETFVPGLIVERRGSSFFMLDALHRLLGEQGLSWRTKLFDADFPDAIEGRKKVGADGSLALPFLDIESGLKKNRMVDFSIGKVHVRQFTDQRLRLWNPLQARLRRLRRDQPEIWKEIKGHYLVVSTWYASQYSIGLGRAVGGELDAKIRQQIAVETGAKVSLDTSLSIVNVKGNKRVPFAFFGRRLRGLG